MPLLLNCDAPEGTTAEQVDEVQLELDSPEPAPTPAAGPERMIWRVSEPERPVHEEDPERFRRAAPAPRPEPVEVEITRFADLTEDERANWPLGPDSLASADGPEIVGSFSALNEYHDRFGYSIVVGDFNGDGYDDLAVGAPFEDYGAESTGLVFLFEGTSGGLTPWALINQIGADEGFDRFGWALAAGDFNGDGTDDLAASALNEGPSGDENAGTVFIFTGGGSGLTDWNYYHQESPALETNEDRDLFGYALSAGNYNGDAYDDLAVGAPGEKRTVREGVVYLLAGGASGMTAMGEVKQSTGALGTAHDDERFGCSLASGDLFSDTGGAKDELVVGAYYDVTGDWRGGSVYIYKYSGGAMTGWGRRDEWTLEENDDDFGRAVAIGDFDGDGDDDLAVGAPGENRDTGLVYLFRSDGTTLSNWETLARSSAQPGDRFGASLATGRIDNDAKDELVVGAPRAVPSGASNRAGVARVFFGHATSMVAHTYEMRQTNFGGSVENHGENSGFAVAIGHFRSATYGDVAVSTPDDQLSGKLRVGSIDVYTGTGSGGSFSFSATQRLAQQ